MKGVVYEEIVYEGVNDMIHGGGFSIRRIYFPSLGITVTSHQKNIYVARRNPADDIAEITKKKQAREKSKKSGMKSSLDRYESIPKVVGEVDLPIEQVQAYAELYTARERAEKYIKPLEELLALVGSKSATA